MHAWGLSFYPDSLIIKAMNKKPIFWIALSALMLSGCAEEAPASSIDSSTPPAGGNTLSSVLGSFGKNIRANVIFNFLTTGGKIPGITMDYVEDGVQFDYRNFPDGYVKGGFLNDSDGKAYAWVNTQVDHQNSAGRVSKVDLAEKVGDPIKNSSNVEVSDFRDAFYSPAYIGEHLADFTKDNVFIPRIKGTTYGTFDLFGKVYESEVGGHTSEELAEDSEEGEEEPSGKLVQDNTEILVTLAKCLGVYDTAVSAGGDVELTSADFYFAQAGTSFSFNFNFTYAGGYDKLNVKVAVSQIGSVSVAALTNYFDPNFEIYVPAPETSDSE